MVEFFVFVAFRFGVAGENFHKRRVAGDEIQPNRLIRSVLEFLEMTLLFIFFENEKEETISNAFVTAEYAENLIDATKVSAYMRSDGNDSEYKQLKRSLSILKTNTPGLDELSVIRVSEDGFSYIFAERIF